MAKTIHQFKKVNGQIQFPEKLQANIKMMIDESNDGDLVIAIRKPKRTVDQNALMWMWFRCLSEDTKSEPAEFYQHYCEKYLPNRCVYVGNKFKSGGTSTLTTKQFTEFLNKIQADAASEFRHTLPIPEDINWEEFYNQYK
jgi:hypothetical protein